MQKRHSKIFELVKPVYSYAGMLILPHQFDKKLKTHFPVNIYLFKIRIVGEELRLKAVHALQKIKLARQFSLD